MISKNHAKQIQSLHLKKNRDSARLFLVEGIKAVEELLQNGGIIKELFALAPFIKKNGELIEKNKIKYYEVSETELKQISMQTSPNNALAVCNFLDEEAEKFDFNSGFTFYLDDIRDPGNFGTIMRLADWYGISTIFCSPESCDFYNPKVIQSTMGAFLRVKVIYGPVNKVISENNIQQVYGAVLNGKNIYKEQLTNGIVLIGNEANGISKTNLDLINRPITIPAGREGGAESLNAAMAASIIASEFFRQLSS